MANESKQHSIEIREEFSVPVEALFKAWTEEEQLKKWWSPMGDSVARVTNELNDGGAVSYEFESGDFVVKGNYHEVKPNEKLVYSWNWEFKDGLPQESYTLTISFEATESGSMLHVRQDEMTSEEVAKPHEDAWHLALKSLKTHLENGTDGNNNPNTEDLKNDEGMSDRSGGYNESPEQAKVGGG